jgi:hypothetical protein
MQKNKRKGIIFILLPFITLTLILTAYAIAKFVLSAYANGQESTINPQTGLLNTASQTVKIAQIINVALGLVGVLAVVSMFILIPLGIYFLSRKEPNATADLAQSEKYRGLTPEQINYINSWSWGAFFGSGIWAVGNKLYIWLLLALIPVVNLYVWIKLSMDGRKMAWEKGWGNFDQFKKRQKIMAWVIVGFSVLYLLSQIT